MLNSAVSEQLREITELKELLEQLDSKLIEQETTFSQLLKDAKKWDELARLIAELRVPVRELKTSTESLMRKAETVLDDVELRELMNELIDNQNKNLQDYLDKANSNALRIASDLNANLKEVITLNSNLIQKFSNYLTIVAGSKQGERGLNRKVNQLYLLVIIGFSLSIITPLFAFYFYPPFPARHTKVLDALYERLFDK